VLQFCWLCNRFYKVNLHLYAKDVTSIDNVFGDRDFPAVAIVFRIEVLAELVGDPINLGLDPVVICLGGIEVLTSGRRLSTMTKISQHMAGGVRKARGIPRKKKGLEIQDPVRGILERSYLPFALVARND
jgi:hypothetical protein